MKRRWMMSGLVLVILAGWWFVDESGASRPVARTLTGCVVGGTFYSVSEGAAQPGRSTPVVYRISVQDMDLSRYEGQKLQIQGYLAPGDRFTPDRKSIRVLGPCDKATRRAIREKGL